MFPLEEILKHDLCSSCGVCAGICPVDCLEMQETSSGEYRPVLINDDCTQCGLCEKVCPFGSGPDEDELGKRLYGEVEGINETDRGGYCLSAACGGISDHDARLKRTSGGLGAWLLAELLKRDIVDRVISVRGCSDPEKLFEFAEFGNAKDVWESSRSCYYPVEISECLQRIKSSALRHAVVGVPCLIKALQKGRLLNKKLRENIAVTVGLACSCQKTKHFTEYLTRRTAIDPEQVKGFSFRVKDGTTPADECLMVRIDTMDGQSQTVLHEEYADMWGKGLFTLKACEFCDDLFAETADIVLMDAKQIDEPIGHSVAIFRSPLLKRIVESGAEKGELVLDDISLQESFDSQNGCDYGKKMGTASMLASYSKDLPEGFKRREAPDRSHSLHFIVKERRRRACQKAFLEQRRQGTGTGLFWKRYRELTRLERVFDLASHVKRFLHKAIRK